jgi:peptide/nickel transport system substrate-binding protein
MIVWRYLPSQHDAAIAVQRGQADWFDGLIPLPDYRQLAIQSPGQLHTHPLFAVEFFAINTHLAPFDNVLVREALNYAIDPTPHTPARPGRIPVPTSPMPSAWSRSPGRTASMSPSGAHPMRATFRPT